MNNDKPGFVNIPFHNKWILNFKIGELSTITEGTYDYIIDSYEPNCISKNGNKYKRVNINFPGTGYAFSCHVFQDFDINKVKRQGKCLVVGGEIVSFEDV